MKEKRKKKKKKRRKSGKEIAMNNNPLVKSRYGVMF